MVDTENNRNVNPYTAPKSYVGEVKSDEAGRFRRLIARIIDSVTSFVLALIIVLVIGIGPFGSEEGSWMAVYSEGVTVDTEGTGFFWTGFGETTVTLFVADLIVYLLLNTYLLSTRGQTVAKYILKIKIVDYYSGNVPRLLYSLVFREGGLIVISLLGFIGYLLSILDALAIFANNRRCLHDYWSFTRVVSTV